MEDKKVIVVGDEPKYNIKKLFAEANKEIKNSVVYGDPSFMPSVLYDKQNKQTIGVSYKRTFPKVGRNSPCPCGSGKKFKKCCGD